VGLPLAGQRVTLRLDGPVAHVLSDGTVVRTLACPVAEQARDRLRGARAGTAESPRLHASLAVRRRSVRGAIMIGRQRIQVGLPHAGKTVESPSRPAPIRSPWRTASPSPRPARPAATLSGTRRRITRRQRPGREPDGRYREPVANGAPARTVHRQALAALGPGLAAGRFERLQSVSIAAWARPAGEQFIVGWVQPSRHPDSFGWYGTKFTINFRRGAKPAVAVNGPAVRFCRLLDDDGREQVRAVQNAIIRRIPPPPAHVTSLLDGNTLDWYLSQGHEVITPYSPNDDVWFRHRDAHDLADWFRLLPALLPATLNQLRRKLS